VSQLALALVTVLRNPSGASRLFTEYVAVALNTHFAYAYGGMRAAAPPVREQLAPWQLRRCEQIMSEGLAETDMVDRLAKACGLPTNRFLAAFRRITDESTSSRLATRTNEVARTRIGSPDRAGLLFPGRRQWWDNSTELVLCSPGRAAPGVSLSLTGLVLSSQPFNLDWKVIAATGVGDILRPLLAVGLVFALPAPSDTAKIAILLAAVPSCFFGILFAVSYRLHSRTTGSMVLASTLFRIATTSVVIAILFP